MTTNQNSGIFSLITRIVFFNIFFTAVLTAISFVFLFSFESTLLNSTPKIELILTFLQNARFSAAILALINIPVFALLVFMTAFAASRVSKFTALIIRIYYCAVLLPVFVLQITSMLCVHIVLKVKEPILPDIISQVVTLFLTFAKNSLTIMLISIAFTIIAASLMFIISTTAFIRLRDYEIGDSRKTLVICIVFLLLCVVFAKGKINGFMSYEDSAVTSNASLNRYAVNGVFKTVKDFIAFNPANIKALSYQNVDDAMGDDKFLFNPDFNNYNNSNTSVSGQVTPEEQLKRINAIVKKTKK
ncbi:MAG: hypothetical protein LBQ47_04750 [Endomicrobium sp.]|nr:hypothetical protein [Endomicrobium sp.]